MENPLIRTPILMAFVIFFSTQLMAAPENVEYRNYWQPTYHGERLAYCNVQGQCGMDVANCYCQLMGYQRADQQVIADNVGLTHFISSPMRCRGWRCNGFKTIRCMSVVNHIPPKAAYYSLRSYTAPRYNHYRVDWCYDGKKDCGRRAAHSFCRRLGYVGQKGFVIEEAVAATQAIGNQKLCFGPSCKGYKEITCYR